MIDNAQTKQSNSVRPHSRRRDSRRGRRRRTTRPRGPWNGPMVAVPTAGIGRRVARDSRSRGPPRPDGSLAPGRQHPDGSTRTAPGRITGTRTAGTRTAPGRPPCGDGNHCTSLYRPNLCRRDCQSDDDCDRTGYVCRDIDSAFLSRARRTCARSPGHGGLYVRHVSTALTPSLLTRMAEVDTECSPGAILGGNLGPVSGPEP